MRRLSPIGLAPYTVQRTFDIMFAEPEVYERVRDSGALSREVVAAHYGLPPDGVKFFVCDNTLAFKASITWSCPTTPMRCSPSNTSMCIEKPIQSRRW